MTETRTCQYEPCSKTLPVTHRADAKFCDRYCRNADGNEKRRVAAATDKRLSPVSGQASGASRQIRPLSEVASDGDLAERFRPLIRTAIFDRLKTTGECHADDLADVYPEGHVDLCRHLATAHFGQMARNKLIQKTEWRKSTAPGRNGGGSWVWKFTKAGWDKYGTAGNSSANGEGTAGTHDAGTLDRPGPQRTSGESSGAPSSSAAVPGGDSAGGGSSSPTSPTPPGPARLPGLEESAAARNMKDAA